LYVPQPQWEVIQFTGAGTVHIDGISVISNCRVPSLTTYGIAALVLILIASSIFVIYRRRKTVTA
jgi:subtilase family serine protease